MKSHQLLFPYVYQVLLQELQNLNTKNDLLLSTEIINLKAIIETYEKNGLTAKIEIDGVESKIQVYNTILTYIEHSGHKFWNPLISKYELKLEELKQNYPEEFI